MAAAAAAATASAVVLWIMVVKWIVATPWQCTSVRMHLLVFARRQQNGSQKMPTDGNDRDSGGTQRSRPRLALTLLITVSNGLHFCKSHQPPCTEWTKTTQAFCLLRLKVWQNLDFDQRRRQNVSSYCFSIGFFRDWCKSGAFLWGRGNVWSATRQS